jgi:uncharacterized membrane protein
MHGHTNAKYIYLNPTTALIGVVFGLALPFFVVVVVFVVFVSVMMTQSETREALDKESKISKHIVCTEKFATNTPVY